ncbi:MAG: dCMP deaminase family protein [Nanoarchaeota archaeon]|nr:dCMP deaminase family protein [Nanoarchaeota archaeon]
MNRVSWDEYFLQIAGKVASRATCDRLHVGAVIVKNKNILSTGYNGSISGAPHCDDVGHLMLDEHCVRTVHAEANAIVQAARNGVCVEGATIYATFLPCWNCFKLIINAGIKRIVYGKEYRSDKKTVSHAKMVGVELVDFSMK